jgi:hypothetical protein
MKKSLLIILGFLFTGSFSISQAQRKYPVAKVYAYKQESHSGMNRKVMDKDGKIIQGNNTTMHYFLYLETYPGKKMRLDQVWVNGQAYSFDTMLVSTPVTIDRSIKSVGPREADTLVPSTNRVVWSINIYTVQITTPTSRYIKQLVSANEVVFAYTYNRKKYYLAVKSTQQLIPDLNQ